MKNRKNPPKKDVSDYAKADKIIKDAHKKAQSAKKLAQDKKDK